MALQTGINIDNVKPPILQEWYTCSEVRRLDRCKVVFFQQSQLTVMLVVVSGCFIATTLPVVVTRSVYIGYSAQQKEMKADTFAFFQLVDTLSDLLMFLNHGMNFLLYCTKGEYTLHSTRIALHGLVA